jgi:hypothetical protein
MHRYRCPYVQHAGVAYALLQSRADYAVCSTFAEDLLEMTLVLTLRLDFLLVSGKGGWIEWLWKEEDKHTTYK